MEATPKEKAAPMLEHRSGKCVESDYASGFQSNSDNTTTPSVNKRNCSDSKRVEIGTPEWISAIKKANYAKTWTRENPTAWEHIVGTMVTAAVAHRRVSIAYAVEQARSKCFTDTHGKTTKISNSLTPAFARMVCAEHPEVTRWVVLHDSVFDSEGMPWDVPEYDPDVPEYDPDVPEYDHVQVGTQTQSGGEIPQ